MAMLFISWTGVSKTFPRLSKVFYFFLSKYLHHPKPIISRPHFFSWQSTNHVFLVTTALGFLSTSNTCSGKINEGQYIVTPSETNSKDGRQCLCLVLCLCCLSFRMAPHFQPYQKKSWRNKTCWLKSHLLCLSFACRASKGRAWSSGIGAPTHTLCCGQGYCFCNVICKFLFLILPEPLQE